MMTLGTAGGCRLYQVGAASLYRPDIGTIHVSMFQSDSYRRFLGQRLTEAVVKRIEENTPMQIAGSGTAQSFLRGRIVGDRKRVLSENAFDDPRDILVGLRVEISWVDRQGVPLIEEQVLRLDEDAHLIPEGGQSMITTQQVVIDRLARQIVNQLEAPW